MIMVVGDGETSKRNSWTWKDILGEGTLEKGMARQGCSKESRVGEGSWKEDNVGDNNCSKERCSKEGSSKYGSVGKGNNLEEGWNSKDGNGDGRSEDPRECAWRNNPYEFDKPLTSPWHNNGI